MKNILNSLLAIEGEARAAALPDKTDENRVQTEITRRTGEIAQEAEARFTVAAREMAEETAARLGQIEADYRKRIAKLEALFFENREQTVEKLVKEILHGDATQTDGTEIANAAAVGHNECAAG